MTINDRVTALERSSAQHERQIKAIRGLVQEGMRLVVETRKDLRETRKDLRTLTVNVNRLVTSVTSASGHPRRKIDLQ